MNIVCASSVTLGEEAFRDLGTLTMVPEDLISPFTLSDADALVVRSKTTLNRDLLEGSKVRFVGTCTAGIDHANLKDLEELGIHFAAAPGCNANSVAEYVVTGLLEAHTQTGFTFAGKTMVIVGYGNVGQQVAAKATSLGMHTILVDPPRAGSGKPENYTDLLDALPSADVLTLHVPLVEQGPHPTRDLIDAKAFAALKNGAILINACRGEVINNAALSAAADDLAYIILDVWDPEPEVPRDLLDLADLASAHIAGHSIEGKVNGTRQIREALCTFFNIDSEWNPKPLLPPPACRSHRLAEAGSIEQKLLPLARACYNIREDDERIRRATDDMGAQFKDLRRNYRVRREWSATRALSKNEQDQALLQNLGFLGPMVSNDPLHGIKLETIVRDLVNKHGWRKLGTLIDIRCFTSDPSVKSSLKFLRRTPWARKKVEELYLETFQQ